MKTPSVSLQRSLYFTMKYALLRFKELDAKDSQALREEYKEWLDACDGKNNYPHILYTNKLMDLQ